MSPFPRSGAMLHCLHIYLNHPATPHPASNGFGDVSQAPN